MIFCPSSLWLKPNHSRSVNTIVSRGKNFPVRFFSKSFSMLLKQNSSIVSYMILPSLNKFTTLCFLLLSDLIPQKSLAEKRNPSVIFWAGWFPVCFFQNLHPLNPWGDDPDLTCAYIMEPPNSFFATNIFCRQERPFNLFMGGGRSKTKAPMLSWYRNPQFRVSMKPGQARVGYGWGVGEFGAPLKDQTGEVEEVFLGGRFMISLC